MISPTNPVYKSQTLKSDKGYEKLAIDVCPYDTESHFSGQMWCQITLNLLKIEGIFGRKDTVLTIRGSNMLSEAFPIILTQVRKVKNTQEVICSCYDDTSSHFPGLSVAKHWLFCLE